MTTEERRIDTPHGEARIVVRRARGAIATLLARFASGAIDILVGTQMLAKGHDFPRVTLDGVMIDGPFIVKARAILAAQ